MSSQRFASITLDPVPPVEEVLDGQFKITRVNETWQVTAHIGTDKYSMGFYPEEDARKILRYCSAHPFFARDVARDLYIHGEEGPLSVFIERALVWQLRVHRRVSVSVELEVEMKGSDAEIADYVREKLGWAVHVKKVNAIQVRDL